MRTSALFRQALGKHSQTVVLAALMGPIASALALERAAEWQLCTQLQSFAVLIGSPKSGHPSR